MKDGNFTGISGIPNQDIAMWEGMGPISDRSKERVGASDVAVVAFRRLMVEAARIVRKGGPAIGTDRAAHRARDHQFLRGRRAEDHQLAKPRRRQRGAAGTPCQTTTSREIAAKHMGGFDDQTSA